MSRKLSRAILATASAVVCVAALNAILMPATSNARPVGVKPAPDPVWAFGPVHAGGGYKVYAEVTFTGALASLTVDVSRVVGSQTSTAKYTFDISNAKKGRSSLGKFGSFRAGYKFKGTRTGLPRFVKSPCPKHAPLRFVGELKFHLGDGSPTTIHVGHAAGRYFRTKTLLKCHRATPLIKSVSPTGVQNSPILASDLGFPVRRVVNFGTSQDGRRPANYRELAIFQFSDLVTEWDQASRLLSVWHYVSQHGPIGSIVTAPANHCSGHIKVAGAFLNGTADFAGSSSAGATLCRAGQVTGDVTASFLSLGPQQVFQYGPLNATFFAAP